jgi:hypothetical protein
MINLATDWLGLSILLCAFSWMAGKRFAAVSLPVAVALAALAVYLPTGSPRLTVPSAGDYTVLGAKIEPNVAILALLDDGKGVVRYYRLPYSSSAANELQNALDGAQNGQGVKAKIDGEGGAEYSGDPPVTGSEVKTPEQPQITLP